MKKVPPLKPLQKHLEHFVTKIKTVRIDIISVRTVCFFVFMYKKFFGRGCGRDLFIKKVSPTIIFNF